MIFFSISNRFHLRFKDRESAGNILGEALKDVIKKEERKNCIVLGIPRGGVITSYSVARKLNCDFDIIIPRKLRAPHNMEIAIGAITEDGTTYLNELLIRELEITADYIRDEKLYQLNEIERRASLYCKKRTSTVHDKDRLDSKTLILVDDGAASGATLIAAARYIKSARDASQIIIAVPIVPKGTVSLLQKEDIYHVEFITSPSNSNFSSIEQFYQDFKQVTDEEVIRILETRFQDPRI